MESGMATLCGMVGWFFASNGIVGIFSGWRVVGWQDCSFFLPVPSSFSIGRFLLSCFFASNGLVGIFLGGVVVGWQYVSFFLPVPSSFLPAGSFCHTDPHRMR